MESKLSQVCLRGHKGCPAQTWTRRAILLTIRALIVLDVCKGGEHFLKVLAQRKGYRQRSVFWSGYQVRVAVTGPSVAVTAEKP